MAEDARWYLPREVSERLGISSSTLRTYAANFSPLLSDRARPEGADAKGFRHRRYDDADLRVLREAKGLLDAGMSYQAVLARLGGDTIPRPAPRRRRLPRGRPAHAPLAGAPIPDLPTPPPILAPPVEPPLGPAIEGIDELRAEMQRLRFDLAVTRLGPAPPPPIDPAAIEGIVAELARVQARLASLEAQLSALSASPPRHSWLARLLRRG